MSALQMRSGCETRRRGAHAGFGQVVAAIALLLQIALPGPHTPLPLNFTNDSSDFSTAFDEHALCLARDDGSTETPGKQAPNPDHHTLAACCLWHAVGALVPAPAATLGLVAYGQSAIFGTPPRQFAPRPLTGALGARAPPTRA
jgi:hypothetical protein